VRGAAQRLHNLVGLPRDLARPLGQPPGRRRAPAAAELPLNDVVQLAVRVEAPGRRDRRGPRLFRPRQEHVGVVGAVWWGGEATLRLTGRRCVCALFGEHEWECAAKKKKQMQIRV